MIIRSLSLERRLARETVRHAGSLAQVVFYTGQMPLTCEEHAGGSTRVGIKKLDETDLRELCAGTEPATKTTANFWRLVNGQGVVMKGNWA